MEPSVSMTTIWAGASPTISEPLAPPSRRCMISSNRRIRVRGFGYQ
jgi:hypothetical protein